MQVGHHQGWWMEFLETAREQSNTDANSQSASII